MALLFATLFATLAVPAQAQFYTPRTVTYVTVEEWVEPGAARLLPVHAMAEQQAIARYGPFRVLDRTRAALLDVTDGASPAQFAAMLRDFPELATLELIECPGTDDDVANLRLGRMIRKARIATYVPRGGSVRSGAVELFLAGATRRIDDGAEFAVHSWIDENGREANDFAAGSSVHAPYLAYYHEMGMETDQARRFYAMTNSVGFGDAKWLGANDMRAWLNEDRVISSPKLAYLDVGVALQ